MKKLSLFLPSLYGGGAERAMVTLANAIAARGYAVDLVLAEARGPYLTSVSNAVRVVDLKSGRVIKSLLPLVSYLRRERPTVLLSAISHANMIALLAKKIAKSQTRVVVSERGTVSGEYQVSKGFFSKVVFKLLPTFYRRADGICAVSNAASADLAQFARLPVEKITTIYNPFDLKLIDQKVVERVEHPWFSAEQPPVILAIGRLNEAKNFSVLIRAFVLMRKQRFARLLILGEGELRCELERQIAENGLTEADVQMPGFAANPYAYLARCAVFVLSSHREGLPGVLIEALACGAPVVSTNCISGPDEILEGGRWGRLVPVGDAQALAQAMAATLDTPRSLLPDGRQRAQDFEEGRAVDAYLKLLTLQ